ncbi:spermidine synthase [Streptacidiphilus rugosus]|uniref:spermidine synthase n=1 Tax=Streptacidiphilus rugosus TaxID=405783 RepID=UPI000561AA67|nr:fused MFS/spermidine synthase [Streptacidiphilus rugosus]
MARKRRAIQDGRPGEAAGRGSGAGARLGITEPVGTGTAELLPDRDRPQAWTVFVDGAPQSHVDLADPSRLTFEYQRRLGRIADLAAPPGRPISALHLGGGGLTLPRYVAATRPRSRQQVAEIDTALTELVRRELPLDRSWQIRVRGGDAREVLDRTPEGWADLVIADIFSGARVPAHCATVEFAEAAARALAPSGLYAANIADGGRLPFARRQVATLRAVFPEVALVADPAVLRGKRFGNLILLAGSAPLPLADLGRSMAADPVLGRIEQGVDLVDFQAGALPLRDSDAEASPAPPADVFRG